MTELSTIVVSTSEHDILNKSSGSLCPASKAKIIALDGKEITQYDTPGELWIQSPSAAVGYLNNQKATAETFVHDDSGRWVKTGDGQWPDSHAVPCWTSPFLLCCVALLPQILRPSSPRARC